MKKNNRQKQRLKTCEYAKWSLIFGIVTILCIIVGAIAHFPICILPVPFTTIIALILGIISIFRIRKRKDELKGFGLVLGGMVIGTVVLVTMIYFGFQAVWIFRRISCGMNLSGLGKAMLLYANDFDNRYPTSDKWCDLLMEYAEVAEKSFRCAGNRQELCSYAINPNADPNGPPDLVLLFETKGGWNLYGGPEILTTENHRPKGCNVLFNDSHVEYIKAEKIGKLKWKVEQENQKQEEKNAGGNFRRPGSHEELKYWLENMVWYHRFTNEEISAATALAEKEIVAALEKFDILPDNRPKRAKDAPLLVLPYPGGRHPRIGFLEGAIDPQRETKFSVFTPWDVNSYVVVDVPEAIWSNLGLTYLAHKHIDTIWTKQGNELPKLEWNRHSDGGLDIERKLPNGIVFGVKVKPTKESVRMEMWLKNGTDEKLSDLRVQNCVMTKMAADFEQQTNDNKLFTNPYVACRSGDGKRWIITAWENCHLPWGNEKCPCFHSDPKFPDAEPGQTHRLRGWLSFYEGTDIEAEFKRIEETGWRKK